MNMDATKQNNRIQTTLTEVVERLMSVRNAIKAGGEVRDSNLKEIRAVSVLLGGLAERYPTARTKKGMTPEEFLDYARGQLAKAMTEGDEAGPRLAALKEALSGAAEVIKQSAGAAEDTESVRIQVEVYQEPGLTAIPEETQTALFQLPETKSIDELLAKVEKLCEDLQKAETQGRGPGGQGLGPGGICTCPKCGAQVKHETGEACMEKVCPKCGAKMARPVDKAWPADMNVPAGETNVQKSAGDDLSWGQDPATVRGPAG
jgi:hypothetical protein